MKAFTGLMKLSIAVVSLALTAMLLVSAAPLVMGGVNIEETTPLTLSNNGANLDIVGEYTVVTSIEDDISNLVVNAYMVSRDGAVTKNLVQVGPVTIDKQNPNCSIEINESIPIAEVAIFFISDNMNSGVEGIVLPITLEASGTYKNNLAGLHLKVTFEAKLSQTGSISVDTTPGATKTTEGGEISKATVNITDVPDLVGLVSSDTSFSLEIGGKTLNLDVVLDGTEDIKLILESDDPDNVSIKDQINTILNAVKNSEDKEITFAFGTNPPETFNTNDLSDAASQYMEQIEGICGSLEMFLDKYAELYKTSGGA